MNITLTRKEAQQVLDALIWTTGSQDFSETGKARVGAIKVLFPAIETLRARLSAPEPEPVAWMYEFGTDNADAVNEVRWYKNVHLTKPTGMVRNVVPLYAAPPQRKWQGLTDEEIDAIGRDEWVGWPSYDGEFTGIYRLLEAKLREKNASPTTPSSANRSADSAA